jgi:RNA polymerase sigma-70 factor, ECF subfamily
MQTAQMSQTVNDDDAIRETLEGNPEAFGLLIQKYKNSLYDMACRILGNAQEAEDVLQDALLEAYRHLDGFRHKSRFSTWLYSIVLNRVRNRIRHNKTIRWYSLDANVGNDEDATPLQTPDKGPSIIKLTGDKLAVEAVEKAVQTLNVDYRTIFILHYIQNLPLQEVAERLGRPVGTVKVYLHRARKILYKRLAPKFAETSGEQPLALHVASA